MNSAASPSSPSVIRGLPLAEETGLGPLTLPAYLRDVTTRYAANEALVMHEATGTTRWSYAELWAQAAAVAKALHACGVGKGERVGVMMTNRPEWLSACFGATMAGGIASGISTFSTPAELDYLLRSSGVSVLLLERRVLKKDFVQILFELEPAIRIGAAGAVRSTKYPFLKFLACVGDGEGAVEGWSQFLARGAQVADETIDATAATVTPADPGLLFFSSGSTSKPKGIMNAHRGVCLQLWRWLRFYGMLPADGDHTRAAQGVRCWSANGFFWSGNFAQAFGGALSSGGSLVLQGTFVADEALRLMEQEKVTLAVAWPHQWKQLEEAPNFASVDLSSLHYVDPTTPLGRHPSVKTDWQEPMAAYGNTETFTISSIFPSGTPRERINKSHGEPQPGNIFKIVDPLSGVVLPMGERGEIAVKGPTLMLGYLGVPLDETLDDEGFFRTGDGGHVDADNRLYWEGRLNDIIKTGGANVSPLEIDDVIRAHPGVKITLTVGVPHDTLGEIVVACIVPFEHASLDENGIREFAREKLASYKVPRRVLFFRDEELATTGSAKIKSSELRKLAAQRLAGAAN
ncbi:class I adenylate-forming enzyme family protein [Solimonas terrae]|uniref:Acyl--CoA ligase n=1 Tax=Solimonas terrae TaxID=1396819 RepID=A0A6M2BNX6_9GAMM|nr:class I adenylate-forming enzyme family protein [Solimonas terrae]NGY03925.1 acyl--CoA ligase [Solimonas terrae]